MEQNKTKAFVTKNKKAILIGAVVLVFLLGVFGIPAIKNYLITRDPINHILYSYAETAKEEKFSYTLQSKFDIKEDNQELQIELAKITADPEGLATYIKTLAQGFSLRSDVQTESTDTKLLESSFVAKVKFGEESFIDINGYFNPWELIVDSPALYPKSFYVDADEIAKDQGISLKEIDFLGYKNLLMEKDDAYKAFVDNTQAYQDLLHEFFKDKVTKAPNSNIPIYQQDVTNMVSVYNYNIKLNDQELFELYDKVADLAIKDTNLQALVVDKYTKITEKAKTDKDFEKLSMTEEEFDTLVGSQKEQLETNWEGLITEYKTQLKAAQEQAQLLAEESGQEQNAVYEFSLAIDKENRMRQVQNTVDAGYFHVVTTTTYNAFGNQVTIIPIEKPQDAVNVYTLSKNFDTARPVVADIANNFTTNVLSGKAMESFLVATKENEELLPEADRAEIVGGIQQSIDEIKGSISFMLMIMGIES